MVRRVLAGERASAVAAAFSTTAKTVMKWVERYRREGLGGLEDRSSRPRRLREPTPPEAVERVIALRRQRFTGQQIAKETGVSPSTVSRILRAAKLSRAKDLEPAEPVVRYERQTPGELIHLDIKKLGRFAAEGHRVTGDRQAGRSRGAGWEYVHVCIDDASRIAFSQIHPDEKKESALACLEAALAYYASLGVTVTRVMTDNGACYNPSPSATSAARVGSGTSAPSPTHPRPTARPSASSRPACANGPTPKPIPPQINAPPSCPPGSIATTGIDHMAA